MKLPAGAPPVATKYPSSYKVRSDDDPRYTATPQTTPRYVERDRPSDRDVVKAKASESSTPLPSGESRAISTGVPGAGVPTTSKPGPAVGGQLAPQTAQAQKAAVAGSMLGPVGGSAGWARTGEARTLMSPGQVKSGDNADFAPINEGKAPGEGPDFKKYLDFSPEPWKKPDHLTNEQWERFLKTGKVDAPDPYDLLMDEIISGESGIPYEQMKAWEDQVREKHGKEARHEQYIQQMIANQMGFGTSGGAVFQQGVTGMKAAAAAEELVADKWMENEQNKIEHRMEQLKLALAQAEATKDRELQEKIHAEIRDSNDREAMLEFLMFAPQLIGEFMQAGPLDPRSADAFYGDMTACMDSDDPERCMLDVIRGLESKGGKQGYKGEVDPDASNPADAIDDNMVGKDGKTTKDMWETFTEAQQEALVDYSEDGDSWPSWYGLTDNQENRKMWEGLTPKQRLDRLIMAYYDSEHTE